VKPKKLSRNQRKQTKQAKESTPSFNAKDLKRRQKVPKNNSNYSEKKGTKQKKINLESENLKIRCRRGVDSSCPPQKRNRENNDDRNDAKKIKVGDLTSNDGGHRSRSRKKKKEEILDQNNNKPKKRNNSGGRSHSFEDTNFEKKTIEKHKVQRKQPIKKGLENHYNKRLNAPHDFLRTVKENFNPGTKFDDVFKEGSTHQAGRGWKGLPKEEVSSQETDPASDREMERVKNGHAAHTLAIGIKPGNEKHLAPGKTIMEIEKLAGNTNIAPQSSNLRLERKMDRSIIKVVKERMDNPSKAGDSREQMRKDVYDDVMKQAEGKTVSNTEKKHLTYFKNAFKKKQNTGGG